MNDFGWLLVLLVVALALLGMTRWDLWGVVWRDLLRLGPAQPPLAPPPPHDAPPHADKGREAVAHADMVRPHKPVFHRSGRRGTT